MARMFQLLNGEFVVGIDMEDDSKLLKKTARVVLQQQGEQTVFTLVPFGFPFIRDFSTVLSTELMFMEIPNTNEFTKAVIDKYYEAVIVPVVQTEPKKKSNKKAKPKADELDVDPSKSEWR